MGDFVGRGSLNEELLILDEEKDIYSHSNSYSRLQSAAMSSEDAQPRHQYRCMGEIASRHLPLSIWVGCSRRLRIAIDPISKPL